MHSTIKEYKEKLKSEILDSMKLPLCERTASHTDAFLKYWSTVCEVEAKMSHSVFKRLTEEEAKQWNAHMINEDGTMGGHWTVEQTNSVASTYGVKFEHITEYCWNVTMNMMYSDYCYVARNFGVDTPEFYACMSKAFLFDKDGPEPKDKLAAYYHRS